MAIVEIRVSVVTPVPVTDEDLDDFKDWIETLVGDDVGNSPMAVEGFQVHAMERDEDAAAKA